MNSTKQAWQMKKVEFRDLCLTQVLHGKRQRIVYEPDPTSSGRILAFNHPAIDRMGNDQAKDYLHRRHVEKALAEGKDVPEDVLDDYPDLKDKQAEPKGGE